MQKENNVTRVLAISGSLRSQSSNTTLLRAVAMLAPPVVAVSIYDGIGNLPHFNPDLEETPGPAVLEFRQRLQESDGVLISSSEYAHGVPGVLKNALDWIVGSGELVDKPVALINASPQSTHAYASLAETIVVMSARLVKNACVTLPFWNKTLDARGVAAHPEISTLLMKSIFEFGNAIEDRRTEGPGLL
jgi:chromate reductase, NAD(P)H dehydrogenase (quinone)